MCQRWIPTELITNLKCQAKQYTDITRGNLTLEAMVDPFPSHSDFSPLSHSRASVVFPLLRIPRRYSTSSMTIRWLTCGRQGAMSQDNLNSGKNSTVVNGSIHPHLEKKELVSYSRARSSFAGITVSNKSANLSPNATRLIPENQCRHP